MKIVVCTWGRTLSFVITMPQSFDSLLENIKNAINKKIDSVMDEFGITRDWAEFIFFFRACIDWDDDVEAEYVNMARRKDPVPS